MRKPLRRISTWLPDPADRMAIDCELSALSAQIEAAKLAAEARGLDVLHVGTGDRCSICRLPAVLVRSFDVDRGRVLVATLCRRCGRLPAADVTRTLLESAAGRGA